jgi:hypothetical protein
LAPVLLGEGVRFYEAPGVGLIRLERTALSEPGQITDLTFRVLRNQPSPVQPTAGVLARQPRRVAVAATVLNTTITTTCMISEAPAVSG